MFVHVDVDVDFDINFDPVFWGELFRQCTHAHAAAAAV